MCGLRGGGRRDWSEQNAWGVLKKISAGPCNFCCVSVWGCLPSKFLDLLLSLASFSAFSGLSECSELSVRVCVFLLFLLFMCSMCCLGFLGFLSCMSVMMYLFVS